MMKKSWFFPITVLISMVIIHSCSTSIDINAPEKPILVVYGVLNPKQSVQYIRVSKGFLVNGDAIKYASENNLSAQNAKVKLSEYQIREINGKKVLNLTNIYELQPDNSIPKEDGIFNKNQVLYKTQPTDTIRPGRYYELEVTLIGNETLSTKAHTVIPSEPFITTPTDKIQVGTNNVLFNYPEIEFYNSYDVKFFSGRKITNDEYLTNGRGYELRIYFKYGIETSPGDTSWQSILRYGPTQPFDKSSCNVASGSMCYRIGAQSFTDFLKSRLTDNSVKYVFDDTPLNESTRLEITSIDTFLFNFLLVNSPVYSDFNAVKPEYTNLSDGAIGIFGSINTFSRFVTLGNCTKHISRLNNTPKPGEFCK
jgi:hypothetical protein